jgi:hypothetical protein
MIGGYQRKRPRWKAGQYRPDGNFVRGEDVAIAPGGRLAVNTSDGGLSIVHPGALSCSA